MHRDHGWYHGLLTALVLLAAAGPARAQFMVMQTRDLRLIYNEFTQSFLAPHVARCFENSMVFYRDVFDYTPSEPVTVFLDDAMDYNNAAAWSAPRNSLWVQIAPTNRVYETSPSNERINHTMNHELAHIAMQDGVNASDRFWRGLFGGKVAQIPEHPETILYAYLTEPRRLSPRWYHEGGAVFLETWMAGGVGRAQGAYDEMVFRAKVLDGSHIYDPIGLEAEGTRVDFQAGVNAYLYGARFMCYLAHIHGPEAVIDWIAVRDGSRKYYTSQFAKVFGKSLDEAWREWIAWERGFQQANLDTVARFPLTAYRDLSTTGLGSVSRAYLDRRRNQLYVAVNYPGVVGHLAAIDLASGEIRRLVDIEGPALYFVTSLAYDEEGDALFYTTHNYEWRDLHRFDLATGKSQRLIRDARIGDLAFNRADRSLWAVRHFNGIATLVRLEAPYREWHQILSPPYEKVAYDIDISPDGRLLSYSFSEASGRQTLRMATIEQVMAGSLPDTSIFDFGTSLPGNFVFTPDGRRLVGSSYYTGISNIWQYDLAAGSMDIVTNTNAGMFRPVPAGGDSLIVFRYSGEGFVPAVVETAPLQDVSAITYLGQVIAEEHPIVTTWNVGSPRDVDLDALVQYEGPYRGLANLGLASIYPVVQGYKNHVGFGLAAHLSDPGYVHALDLDLAYSPATQLPESERLHGRVHYGRGHWQAEFKHNAADFYDLFGPLKTSRRGQSLSLNYKATLVEDKPKRLDLSVTTAGYTNLEKLPYAQNIDATYDQLWSTVATLAFTRKMASIGAVNPEKGYAWNLGLANNYADRRSFPLGWVELEGGFPLLFPHSALWLKGSGGYSPGDPDVTFANFYFGGFQNNYVDHRSIRRFQDFDTFPGLEINQVGGTNFTKALAEWDLPPIVFKRLGSSALYLTWLRCSLFASGLVTNLDDDALQTRAANVGAQVDLRFALLSRLEMTLSAGYAAAWLEHTNRSDEMMVSLKILQ